MLITYLGHSAFEIKTQKDKILIDPFLIASPDYDIKNTTEIFVTHGHSDHLGNAIDISKKTGAKITAVFELANYCASNGASIKGIGLGAWIKYPWGRVIATPALHSSSTPEGFYAGCPCGFIFDIDEKIIYHAGDTCLNSEMKLIGEIYHPDLALLPIGGTYTMDIEHATIASDWIKANTIIPMHYNTFEAINVDVSIFEKNIKNISKNPLILNIGEAFNYQ